MKADEFVVWLEGFLDAVGNTLTSEQVALIKEKSKLVMLRGPFMRRNVEPTLNV